MLGLNFYQSKNKNKTGFYFRVELLSGYNSTAYIPFSRCNSKDQLQISNNKQRHSKTYFPKLLDSPSYTINSLHLSTELTETSETMPPISSTIRDGSSPYPSPKSSVTLTLLGGSGSEHCLIPQLGTSLSQPTSPASFSVQCICTSSNS